MALLSGCALRRLRNFWLTEIGYSSQIEKAGGHLVAHNVY